MPLDRIVPVAPGDGPGGCSWFHRIAAGGTTPPPTERRADCRRPPRRSRRLPARPPRRCDLGTLGQSRRHDRRPGRTRGDRLDRRPHRPSRRLDHLGERRFMPAVHDPDQLDRRLSRIDPRLQQRRPEVDLGVEPAGLASRARRPGWLPRGARSIRPATTASTARPAAVCRCPSSASIRSSAICEEAERS